MNEERIKAVRSQVSGLKLIEPLGHIVTGFRFNSLALGGGNNQVPKKSIDSGMYDVSFGK